MKNIKQNSMNGIRKFSSKIKVFTILLLCAQFAYGQTSLDKLDLINDLSFGMQARSMSLPANIGDYGFHSKVGGISFETTAKPTEELRNQRVSLDYINNQFVIEIGAQKFYPELPNWQLVPVANYANSQYQAAFTIYGKNFNDNGAALRYHPAFVNNLLGLRLFQADILLPAPDMQGLLTSLIQSKEDIEKELTAQIKKMKQEGYSDNIIYEQYSQIYQLALGKELPKTNYVKPLSDLMYELSEASIKMFGGFSDIDDNHLSMWKLPEEESKYIFALSEGNYVPQNIDYLKKTENDLAIKSAKIQSIMIKKMQDKYKSLSTAEQQEKVTEFFSQLANEMFFQSQYILTDWGRDVYFGTKQGKFQLTGNPWYLFSVIDDNNKTVQILSEESKLYNENWDLLKKYNPAVITTVENTMQWSAFFRYVKQNNPGNWNDFLSKIKNLSNDAPTIITPTSYEYRE